MGIGVCLFREGHMRWSRTARPVAAVRISAPSVRKMLSAWFEAGLRLTASDGAIALMADSAPSR